MVIDVAVCALPVRRVQSLLARFGTRGWQRLFSDEERRTCAGGPSPEQRYTCRLAAKLALRRLWPVARRLPLRDIEVTGGDGPPTLRLRPCATSPGQELPVGLSLSHTSRTGVAMVVLRP
jgi:phosphopantetheinyl transferase (holo-ACP synthase)